MTKKEFLKEVVWELDEIKKNATKEEISKLNFKDFNHSIVFNCIYGQLTGVSNSDRAKEIVPKKYTFLDGYEKGSMWTALEKYLFIVGKRKHYQIIQYLKGEIQEIKI